MSGKPPPAPITIGAAPARPGANTAQPSPSSGYTETIPIVKTREQLEPLIKEAGNKVVLIEFYAEWCGPCKNISIFLESLADQFKGSAVFVKVDVDEMDDYALQCGVSAMPSCLFLKGGVKVDFLPGSDVEKIKKTLEKHANPDKDAIKTVKR